MPAAYPKEHIPQDVYEKMMKEKIEKDRIIIGQRARAKKMAKENKLAKEKAEKEPKLIQKNKKLENKLWAMKYNEQIKMMCEMTGLSVSKVRKKFRYEKDRVKELIRLHK